MIETVIKRGGDKEPFDVKKIEQAVTGAAKDVNVEGDEVSKVVRAVVDAVNKEAGDRPEVATSESREWALSTLDEVNSTIADGWRAYDEKHQK